MNGNSRNVIEVSSEVDHFSPKDAVNILDLASSFGDFTFPNIVKVQLKVMMEW